MPTFKYTARSKKGEKVEDTVEANDKRSAMAKVERLGLIPVSVTEATAAQIQSSKKKSFLTLHGAPKMGTREILIFTTELSDLLASGMTLGNALNCLANRETNHKGRDAILADLRGRIIQGSSLSEALAQHPTTFTNLYISMIKAGEASGALDEVLKRLVVHYERIQDTKEKVTMALVYPAIVLSIGALSITILMVTVVPKFEQIFKTIEQTLPLPTQILISSSRWLVQYGWILVGVIVFLVFMAKRAINTKNGRLWWDGLKLRVPLIKGVIASGIYANFARTLGTLLHNGVPVLQALGIVENTVGNAVIGEELHNAREKVTDGTTISGPLAAGKIFPPLMTDMLSIGEQTGDMSSALEHIAKRYEGELNRNLKIFTTALEPMLIVVVALIIGFVAVSIIMAIFQLTNGLGGA